MAADQHREGCASTRCAVNDFLERPHLRVQISPPSQPWMLLRYCDLVCLQDWCEDEAQSAGQGAVFTRDEWIDSHG